MKMYYLIQMLEIGSRSLNLQNFSKTRKSIGYVPPCLCFLLSIHGWEYRKGTAEISYLVTNERAWDDQWMTNGRSMNPILSICEESPYSYFWVNFTWNQHNEQAVGKSWQKHGRSGSRSIFRLVVQCRQACSSNSTKITTNTEPEMLSSPLAFPPTPSNNSMYSGVYCWLTGWQGSKLLDHFHAI